MPRIPYAFPLILGVMAFTTSCGDDGNSPSNIPSNIPPEAAFTPSCTLLACAFADGSTDLDGQVTAYAWDFGDGAVATSQNSNHLYGFPGVYLVELTVTDDGGASDNLSQQVTVAAAPTGIIGLSQTSFTFAARRYGAVLLNLPLEITYTGAGILTWTASSNAPNWLSISPASGTAPSSNVLVGVNTEQVRSLGGTYRGTITISAADLSISPRTISVTLRLR